jgi:hypothetical protein
MLIPMHICFQYRTHITERRDQCKRLAKKIQKLSNKRLLPRTQRRELRMSEENVKIRFCSQTAFFHAVCRIFIHFFIFFLFFNSMFSQSRDFVATRHKLVAGGNKCISFFHTRGLSEKCVWTQDESKRVSNFHSYSLPQHLRGIKIIERSFMNLVRVCVRKKSVCG